MSRFIAVNHSTEYLLPPSLEDGLPKNHLARFVVDVVERLDLSALIKAYAGRGKDAHHPAVLLGRLIYGYATGVYLGATRRARDEACETRRDHRGR